MRGVLRFSLHIPSTELSFLIFAYSGICGNHDEGRGGRLFMSLCSVSHATTIHYGHSPLELSLLILAKIATYATNMMKRGAHTCMKMTRVV